MARKRKSKWRWLRFRKGDHGHNLIVAAQRWIHANGGTAVVLGGIGLMEQGTFKYSLVIGACGKMPEAKKGAQSIGGVLWQPRRKKR